MRMLSGTWGSRTQLGVGQRLMLVLGHGEMLQPLQVILRKGTQ